MVSGAGSFLQRGLPPPGLPPRLPLPMPLPGRPLLGKISHRLPLCRWRLRRVPSPSAPSSPQRRQKPQQYATPRHQTALRTLPGWTAAATPSSLRRRALSVGPRHAPALRHPPRLPLTGPGTEFQISTTSGDTPEAEMARPPPRSAGGSVRRGRMLRHKTPVSPTMRVPPSMRRTEQGVQPPPLQRDRERRGVPAAHPERRKPG